MAEQTPPDLMDVLDHAMATGDTSGTLDGSSLEDLHEGDATDQNDGGEDLGDETPPEGDADADGAGDDEGGEGDEPGEGETRERGPDGKFLKKGEKPAEEIDPATGKPKVKAEEKPGEKPGEKKADPLNDPIPKDLKPATQERIRALVTMNRETSQKLEKATQDFDYLIRGVQATGTTPEQYGELLSFMSLFNSPDPANQEKALELVETVADRLATLLGKERTVGDPLAAHADLTEAVAKGQITAQYAKEIARTRNSQGFRTELSTQANEQQQREQAFQREQADARTALTTLEATLKASDPDYERKKAHLVPILQPIFKTLPPKEWPAKFQEAYKAVKLPAQVRRAAPPGRQPLRAGGNAGGGRAAPGAGNRGASGNMQQEAGSMLDAVSAALDSMPR